MCAYGELSLENLYLPRKGDQSEHGSSFLKETTLKERGSITTLCSGKEPALVDQIQETFKNQA